MANNETDDMIFERGSDVITIKEAAARLGMKVDKLKSYIKRGIFSEWAQYLPHENPYSNGRWLLRRKSFERWSNMGSIPVVEQHLLVIDDAEKYNELASLIIANVARQ